ncbi:MAG: TrkH family potassium uptake protein [Candidatus Bipolaricaulota bacterium]
MRAERVFLDEVQVVLRALGHLAAVVGLMTALSIPVAAWFGEWNAVWPFALSSILAAVLGGALYFPCRGAGDVSLHHALIIAALGWLLVALLGALPFYLVSVSTAGASLPYADFSAAFFEAVSGFTSTGLTMATRPDLLPHSLQWWRTFTEWVGGVGVIVLMLTLIAGPGRATMTLYLAEARTEKIHPSVISTVRTIWWIFLLFTGVSILALWVAGMPVWEAVNHGMTGIATGGFTLWPDSIGHYDSSIMEMLLLVIMLAGSVSFAVHYRASRYGLGVYMRDVQTRWFVTFLVIGALLVSLEALLRFPVGEALRHGTFQYFSAMTCTGFQSTSVAGWSDAAKLLLAVGMVIGGAAGSTTGGIKVMRYLLLLKGVGWKLRKTLKPPDAVVPFRVGGHVFPGDEAWRRLEEAMTIAFLWMGFLLVGILAMTILLGDEYALADVVFEVASAQGNVGLSTGITHPEMPTAAKLVLSFNMWVGRLEIIPVLMLLRGLIGATR